MIKTKNNKTRSLNVRVLSSRIYIHDESCTVRHVSMVLIMHQEYIIKYRCMGFAHPCEADLKLEYIQQCTYGMHSGHSRVLDAL